MKIKDYEIELNKKDEEIKELKNRIKELEHARFNIGNLYKTQEESKFQIERLKVVNELKKYSCEFKVDNENYYLIYECLNGLLYFTYDYYHKRSDIYFESEEKVKEAIEHVGKERILKYYLGVKEKK